jgi:integrase
MPRPATGSIVEPNGTRKSYGLRFRANGKRQFVTLGRPEDGWTLKKAEEELENVLADVRRGRWEPPTAPVPAEPSTEMPTFHEFASDWYAGREPDWAPNTRTSIRGALQNHLLPVFADKPLDAITVEDVDRFARAKRAEGRLGNNSINQLIQYLAAVLDQAVEWNRIPTNPAKGRRRKLPPEAPKRIYMEPEQLPALLRGCKPHLRPLVAVLAGCGLRIGEAVALKWEDVNLLLGTIQVLDSKTPAGIRSVDMPLATADEIRSYYARRKPRPTDPVFLSVYGRTPQCIRNAESALPTAVKAANKELGAKGIDPISEGLTPHSLRRLYASLRFGAKDDPVYVCEQGGWTDPAFAMKVYAKAIRRRSRLSGIHAEEFDAAIEWARMGTNDVDDAFQALAKPLAERPESERLV